MDLNRLRGYMKMHKKSVAEVATYLGIKPNTMYLKLRGHSKITLLEAKDLADLFDTTIEDIFFTNQVTKKVIKHVKK